ncbi:LysR family transcriptional regulator [Williamsia sp. 1135]|uniref:LysR family transcriptional regulator n=1 Tax=Williamsia sp. 1135 TaxID=1889262 RepID=UPI000A109F89|nr:LysR family transcriptional regulator [Williamsia sp. 1135]ORM37665.1 LysR family transcriptional regulator [Williamsia sp. 1135]
MDNTWFVTLAELENMSAAADELHATQPTLSRQLGRLERDLGIKLFDRKGKRLVLNAAGRIYLRHVRRAVAEIDAARYELAELANPVAGRIDLGFLHSFGMWLVPTLIREFRREPSQVVFGLAQGAAEDILQRVLGGDSDVAIVSPRPNNVDVGWVPIMRQHLGVAVPDGHRLAHRDRVTIADVREESFVAMETGFGMRRILEELCAAEDFHPKITFESTELATVAGLVAAGLGVAVMPVEHDPQLPAGVSLIVLDGPTNIREVGLIWKRDTAMSPAAARFRDFVTGWADSNDRRLLPGG